MERPTNQKSTETTSTKISAHFLRCHFRSALFFFVEPDSQNVPDEKSGCNRPGYFGR
jgi:hypothetical protein